MVRGVIGGLGCAPVGGLGREAPERNLRNLERKMYILVHFGTRNVMYKDLTLQFVKQLERNIMYENHN